MDFDNGHGTHPLSPHWLPRREWFRAGCTGTGVGDTSKPPAVPCTPEYAGALVPSIDMLLPLPVSQGPCLTSHSGLDTGWLRASPRSTAEPTGPCNKQPSAASGFWTVR